MESALRFPLLLFSKSIRAVYHKLPMTAEGKSQMKSFVYENFSFLVKGTKSYQHWLMMRTAFDQPELNQTQANQFHRLTKEDLMKVLQHSDDRRMTISAFIPYNFLPQTFGGGLRIMSIYESLSRDFNINLVGVVGYGAAFEKREISTRLTVYLVPMSREYYELLTGEQKKAGGLLHDILLTDHYEMIPALVDLCRQLVSETDIFISSQPYFFKMMIEYCRGRELVYDAQNVDYDLKQSYFENPEGNETAKRYLKMVYDVEALGCQKSGFILYVSGEDRKNLCRIYGADQDKMVMVPNGIDVHACHFMPAPKRLEHRKNSASEKKQVVFVGSAHGPNIEAAEFIVNEMAAQNENIQYTIIGNLQTVFKDKPLPSNVRFTGMISAEDKERFYQTADLAVNPMFSGSGTNLKVLEYVAYGIPLVSTPFGMRGLEVFNDHIILADKDEFATAVEKALATPGDVLEQNTRAARKICEEHFDKSVINEALINRIRTLEKTRRETCRIAIDGRILHRNVTGSERYIYELVNHILTHQDEACRLYLVNHAGLNIANVSNIPCVSVNQRIDLFHRTYQVGSYNDLLELLIARKSIFSFLDLILCKNPDYFRSKEEHRSYVELMSLALNFADRILAISEHAKKDVVENFNISSEKIDVVYLGLNFNKFHRVSDGKELDEFRAAHHLPQKFILYVGTDYPHKNLKNLYIAFSKILNLPHLSDYFLVTAGINYYRQGTGYLQSDLNRVKDRVISLGHFDDEKLHLLYNAASIFVFPSLYEGFGLTVLEAMACGAPVICSDATSLPEVVGDAAYLVDARDPEIIAKAIDDVATNSSLRNALIEKGLERVKLFTWEKCAEETYAVYEKLLHSEDRGRAYDDQKLKLLQGKIINGNLISRRNADR